MIRTIAIASALAASLGVAPGALAQQLYKWTDEKGVVHYTDKAPPDARGSTVLDKQGRQVGKIEPPPSPEQARAKQAEEDRQRATAREQESTLRRDRALMQSYTSESEIELARARTVATYESQIQSAQAYLTQLTKRKQEIDLRKSRFADKPLPPQLEHDSANVDAEFAKNRDLVAQKQRELATVNARYEADKARWRELKALEASSGGSAPKSASAPPVAAAPAPKK
jgi:hypothetical protein